jgi:hypothetical protein
VPYSLNRPANCAAIRRPTSPQPKISKLGRRNLAGKARLMLCVQPDLMFRIRRIL